MTPKLLFLLESNVAGRSEGWRWGGVGASGGGGGAVTTTLSSNGLSIYPALAQQSSASAALSASIA